MNENTRTNLRRVPAIAAALLGGVVLAYSPVGKQAQHMMTQSHQDFLVRQVPQPQPVQEATPLHQVTRPEPQAPAAPLTATITRISESAHSVAPSRPDAGAATSKHDSKPKHHAAAAAATDPAVTGNPHGNPHGNPPGTPPGSPTGPDGKDPVSALDQLLHGLTGSLSSATPSNSPLSPILGQLSTVTLVPRATGSTSPASASPSRSSSGTRPQARPQRATAHAHQRAHQQGPGTAAATSPGNGHSHAASHAASHGASHAASPATVRGHGKH